jgi:hypothetical protein
MKLPRDGKQLWANVKIKFRVMGALHHAASEANHQRHCRSLVTNPAIAEELERWWVSAQLFDDNDDGVLEFDEYERFHTNLVGAFNKHEIEAHQLSEEQAQSALKKDWARDSGGKPVVDQSAFYVSVIELAMTWCEADPQHHESQGFYLAFLQKLFLDIFSLNPEQDKKEYLQTHTHIAKSHSRLLAVAGFADLRDSKVRRTSVFQRRPSLLDLTDLEQSASGDRGTSETSLLVQASGSDEDGEIEAELLSLRSVKHQSSEQQSSKHQSSKQQPMLPSIMDTSPVTRASPTIDMAHNRLLPDEKQPKEIRGRLSPETEVGTHQKIPNLVQVPQPYRKGPLAMSPVLSPITNRASNPLFPTVLSPVEQKQQKQLHALKLKARLRPRTAPTKPCSQRGVGYHARYNIDFAHPTRGKEDSHYNQSVLADSMRIKIGQQSCASASKAQLIKFRQEQQMKKEKIKQVDRKFDETRHSEVQLMQRKQKARERRRRQKETKIRQQLTGMKATNRRSARPKTKDEVPSLACYMSRSRPLPARASAPPIKLPSKLSA